MSYVYLALIIIPVLFVVWFIKDWRLKKELRAQDQFKDLSDGRTSKWFDDNGKLDLKWDPLSQDEDICLPYRHRPQQDDNFRIPDRQEKADEPLMVQRWRRAQIRHKAAQKRAREAASGERKDENMRIAMTKAALDDMEIMLKAAGHDISKL